MKRKFEGKDDEEDEEDEEAEDEEEAEDDLAGAQLPPLARWHR